MRYLQSAIEFSGNETIDIVDNLLLCHSPKYNSSESINPQLATRGQLTDLHYTQDEVNQIAEIFPNTQSYESLDFKDLNHKLKKANVYHYAGHAFARNDSAYLVQVRDGRQELLLDGQIREITNQLDLVTLSACETGLGTYHAGEGIASLATSFLNSGAKAIVYSLWNANDASTSTIMKRFYNQLAVGKEKSEALRLAKLDYIKSSSPEGRHPYYWAAFSLVGDDRPIVSSSHSLLIWTLLLLTIIAVLYFFFQNKLSKQN